MPLISGNYNPQVGILVQIAILTQQQAGDPASVAASKSSPLNVFMALVDTGASVTCISKSAAAQAGLQPSGKTTMSGSTGHGAVDQYTFGVGLIMGAQQEPTGVISGSLNVHLVQGCEFTNHGFGFDVLLGRDVICKGGLALTFDGHWHFAI